MNSHKHSRRMMSDSLQEIQGIDSKENIASSLHKAPIEYSPHEGGMVTRPLKAPSESWNQIHEAQLPNGLTYKQFKRDDAFVHQIYHPNHSNPVAEVRTRAVGHPDYDKPQEHMVTWSQTDPAFKGKGLGRQAYLATVLHGKGVNKLQSGTELSLKGHAAWKQLSKIPGLATKLAPYATDKDFELDPDSYNQAARQWHSIKISNSNEFDMSAMFPQVDINEEKLAASEELEKAKEDILVPPQQRKTFRAQRAKFEGQDPLAQDPTNKLGVSDIGIETRRADPKQKGVFAHGYARVGEPEFHNIRAKQKHRALLEQLKQLPKMTKMEDLEKAEPPPTHEGEISQDGRKKAIAISGGEIVWDMHPKLKQAEDADTIEKAKAWLNTQPAEHHPILKQFINSVLKDPYRHVRYGSNEKNGPLMPRLRHIKQMVTNHPESKLIVHSPEFISLHVGRHGVAGGISHFVHDLKKGLVKSENLSYNGVYGSYTDTFGNTYRFSDTDGRQLSKSERDALGTTDGLLRQFRRLAKADEATVRSISELLRHSGMRGEAGSRGDAKSNGAPQSSGAQLHKSEMNRKKYTLKYHAPKGQGAYGLHTVTAHDHLGDVVGELSAEDLGDGTIQANMVEVHPEHRRKGIAGAMYDYMQSKTGLNAIPDLEAQTNDARKFWANRKISKSENAFEHLQKASATKKLLGALGLAAATAMPMTQPPNEPKFSPAHEYKTSSNAKKNVDLRAIAEVESRGGKDTKHKVIMTGINAGSSAVGKYGLMPLTIKDIVSKNAPLKKYKNVLGYSDSELHNFMLKNPNFEKEVASTHYDNLSRSFNGNLNHIAYAWLNGKAGTFKALKAGKDIDNHWHIKKINNAKQKILNLEPKQEKPKENNEQAPKIILP